MNSNITFNFTEAKKLITSREALDSFLKSNTYQMIMDFIVSLQKSVEGKSLNDVPFPKENSSLANLSNVLVKLQELIKETPPLEDPQRFGNKAFKLWYDKVEEQYSNLISSVVDKERHPDIDLELKSYFLDCFGSSKRLDYGTGHELNFLCILLILFVTGYYKDDDFAAVVTHIFFPYILLVRNLQITYKLEPAGAHGVWGLDEYHFLPFLFGASQLVDNKEDIVPSSIHTDKLLDSYEDQFMYLSCVKYVKQVKRGNFAEHSPMLDSISNVPNWGKVAKGLVKMYIDEVMKKYVVMQHFYFGSIIKFN